MTQSLTSSHLCKTDQENMGTRNCISFPRVTEPTPQTKKKKKQLKYQIFNFKVDRTLHNLNGTKHKPAT